MTPKLKYARAKKSNVLTKRKTILIALCFLVIHATETFSQTDFGEKLATHHAIDISGISHTVPVKKNVTVLIFFNVSLTSHGKTLKQFDKLYEFFLKQSSDILFFGISKGINQEFKIFQQTHQYSTTLINDMSENFIELFGYSCGKCMRVVIIDKRGIIRYNAGYINLDAVSKIVRRYDDEK